MLDCLPQYRNRGREGGLMPDRVLISSGNTAKIEGTEQVVVSRAELERLYSLKVAELRVLCELLGYPLPLTGKERKRQEQAA